MLELDSSYTEPTKMDDRSHSTESALTEGSASSEGHSTESAPSPSPSPAPPRSPSPSTELSQGPAKSVGSLAIDAITHPVFWTVFQSFIPSPLLKGLTAVNGAINVVPDELVQEFITWCNGKEHKNPKGATAAELLKFCKRECGSHRFTIRVGVDDQETYTVQWSTASNYFKLFESTDTARFIKEDQAREDQEHDVARNFHTLEWTRIYDNKISERDSFLQNLPQEVRANLVERQKKRDRESESESERVE